MVKIGDLTKNFSTREVACQCGCKSLPEFKLISLLQDFRDFVKKSIIIHSCKRCMKWNKVQGGVPTSWHVQGLAADLHINQMVLTEMFAFAHIFKKFTHIGVYPYWNNPGLHVDIGDYAKGTHRFYSPRKGVYLSIEKWPDYQKAMQFVNILELRPRD